MKNLHERTDDYAIKGGGYEAKSFTFACIKEGKTAILQRIITADSYKEKMKKLFFDDVATCRTSMTFLWAQACMVAIWAGVNERAADNIYRDHYLKADFVDTIDKFMSINEEILVGYARAVREVKENNNYSARVLECKNYVAEHLCDELSVEKLAAELGFSPNYLSQQFKKETGRTIMSYIQEEKINTAKIMIEASEMSLGEIMSYLGYTSQSHFSETFKKYTGLTPGKYKKYAYLQPDKGPAAYKDLVKDAQTEDTWFTDALDYAKARGNEEQAYIFSCIRRGKVSVLKEQLEDVSYMAGMQAFFGGSILHATETMLCLWPQAANAAIESGVDSLWMGEKLKTYISSLYGCMKTEEMIELNVHYLIELAQKVSEL